MIRRTGAARRRLAAAATLLVLAGAGLAGIATASRAVASATPTTNCDATTCTVTFGPTLTITKHSKGKGTHRLTAYLAKATATDRAGNTASKTVKYTVKK